MLYTNHNIQKSKQHCPCSCLMFVSYCILAAQPGRAHAGRGRAWRLHGTLRMRGGVESAPALCGNSVVASRSLEPHLAWKRVGKHAAQRLRRRLVELEQRPQDGLAHLTPQERPLRPPNLEQPRVVSSLLGPPRVISSSLLGPASRARGRLTTRRPGRAGAAARWRGRRRASASRAHWPHPRDALRARAVR